MSFVWNRMFIVQGRLLTNLYHLCEYIQRISTSRSEGYGLILRPNNSHEGKVFPCSMFCISCVIFFVGCLVGTLSSLLLIVVVLKAYRAYSAYFQDDVFGDEYTLQGLCFEH